MKQWAIPKFDNKQNARSGLWEDDVIRRGFKQSPGRRPEKLLFREFSLHNFLHNTLYSHSLDMLQEIFAPDTPTEPKYTKFGRDVQDK